MRAEDYMTESGNAGEGGQPLLYRDLADWWPLLSDPEEYAEAAAVYSRTIQEAADSPVRTVLELGCGGGNNASHMKKHFALTLSDVSVGMLEVSRALNPQCEHVLGDMRHIRLGRQFDAVFVQDAIMYMATEEDLASAMATAAIHCRPGGVALFAPDHIRETFRPSCSHGGHDRGNRGLRYLEWHWDPDPNDTVSVSDMVYLLRDGNTMRYVYDRHVAGLFPRQTWIALLERVGFEVIAAPAGTPDMEPALPEFFLARKPA
jgi:SAM-dependent methyltransferase